VASWFCLRTSAPRGVTSRLLAAQRFQQREKVAVSVRGLCQGLSTQFTAHVEVRQTNRLHMLKSLHFRGCCCPAYYIVGICLQDSAQVQCTYSAVTSCGDLLVLLPATSASSCHTDYESLQSLLLELELHVCRCKPVPLVALDHCSIDANIAEVCQLPVLWQPGLYRRNGRVRCRLVCGLLLVLRAACTAVICLPYLSYT
jgi:hypothetical protein